MLWLTLTRTPLGVVHEILGLPENPFYVVRCDSAAEIHAGAIAVGVAVSFAPQNSPQAPLLPTPPPQTRLDCTVPPPPQFQSPMAAPLPVQAYAVGPPAAAFATDQLQMQSTVYGGQNWFPNQYWAPLIPTFPGMPQNQQTQNQVYSGMHLNRHILLQDFPASQFPEDQLPPPPADVQWQNSAPAEEQAPPPWRGGDEVQGTTSNGGRSRRSSAARAAGQWRKKSEVRGTTSKRSRGGGGRSRRNGRG